MHMCRPLTHELIMLFIMTSFMTSLMLYGLEADKKMNTTLSSVQWIGYVAASQQPV